MAKRVNVSRQSVIFTGRVWNLRRAFLLWAMGLVLFAHIFGATRVLGQTTDQIPERGSVTEAAALAGSGAGAPAQTTCAAGAQWMRLRFTQLVLQGSDSLQLTGSRGGLLVLQGNNWANRVFFTRALAGDCVTVRPSFTQAGSQFSINARQHSVTPLANSPMVAAGAGDICDTGLVCVDTARLITQMNPLPDVVFTAGDNQYDAGLLTEYNRDYNPTWGQFKSITRPVPGNHEYQSGNNGNGYFDYFNGIGQNNGPAGPRGQGYYSYDVGEWHVIVLNTGDGNSAGVVPYGVGSAQEQWLRRDLAANTKYCTIAMMHHPRFSQGRYRPGIGNTHALWQALQDFRVDVVVSGHDHNYQRYHPQRSTSATAAGGVRDDVNGIRLFVVGTGGRNFYAFTGTQANFANGIQDIDGVLRFTLGENSYAWDFVSVPGSAAFSDSGSSRCLNAPQFDVTVAPSSLTVARGQTASATVTVSSPNGDPTNFSLSGLPAGVTASFTPNPVTPTPGGTATATLNLSASATAATGVFPLTITATAGALTDSVPLSLSIPDPDPPSAPTGLIASAGAGIVSLSWSANSESDLARYSVKRSTTSGGPYTQIGSVNAPTRTFTDAGVAGGTTFYYVVSAFDTSNNESRNSPAVQATPQVAHVLLEDSPATGSKMDVKLGQSGAQSFNRVGGGNYYISRLVLDVSREFDAPNGNLQVSLGTRINAGAISTTADITPAMVTDNSAGTTFQTMTVTFNPPVGPLTPGTTYYINLVNNASNGKAYLLRYGGTSVYPRGTYYKTAANDAKDIRFQLWGTSVPDTLAPAAPTGIVANAPGVSGQVTVDWANNSEADLASYRVKRATTSGGPYAVIATVSAPTSIYTDNGATNGTANYYVVTAVDSSGNESTNSAQVSATPFDAPPPAPTGVTAAGGNGQIVVDWANSPAADIASYRVKRATTTGGPYVLITTVTAPTSIYTDAAVTNGTTYYYVITAVDAAGQESGNSTQVSATPASVPQVSTFISRGSRWSYLDNGSNQGTAWRAPAFNDTAWPTGLAEFGYGDGDERTVLSYGGNASLKHVTTYFRRHFNVANPAAFSSLRLNIKRDDGVVVYVNGTEVLRNNMPAGAIGYLTFASSALSGTNESNYFSFTLGTGALVAGDNVIAVEIHQANRTSSDISFDLELFGNP